MEHATHNRYALAVQDAEAGLIWSVGGVWSASLLSQSPALMTGPEVDALHKKHPNAHIVDVIVYREACEAYNAGFNAVLNHDERSTPENRQAARNAGIESLVRAGFPENALEIGRNDYLQQGNVSNYIEQPESGQLQDNLLNTDPTVIEAKVMKDYAHYLGKDVLVHRICGFVGDDSTDIELSPPAKVRVQATSEQSLKRWIDGWCDPLYEVALVENHPQLNGVRSLWIHGPSLHLNGKQTEVSDIVSIAEPQSVNQLGSVQNTTVPKVESALDRGLRLRTQALALLQEAQAADGLKPFTVTHTHSYGESTYVLWAAETPTQEHAKAVLDCEFEPERDETLAVEDCFTLEEMTGVALTARLQDILDSSESPCQDDTPSP